jgi:7-carboxy-7-deazaguanine synthase
MALLVNEIFYSIQGESLNAGRPCVFVRLTGCNLRCRYCDTTYAYEEGENRGIREIIREVEKYGCPLVEVTGGEPLSQPDTPNLIDRLLDAGYETMLETNGSLDISSVDTRCMKILDIKCPSSGESAKNRYENLRLLTASDQVKFVIGDLEDYEFAKKKMGIIPRILCPDHVLFSPVSKTLPLELLAEWILRDNLPVRLHAQLHKMIWPEAIRGR